MRAADLMTTAVLTVPPDAPAKRAARLLVDRGFCALPVVDGENRLVGIVTEVDLIRNRLLPDPRRLIEADPEADPPTPPEGAAPSVGGVMTPDPIVVHPGTDAVTISTLMLDRHLRAVPVVDCDRLVGIVTRRDLLRTIARDDEAIARDVRRRVAMVTRLSWDVRVSDGVVELSAERADADDRHVATVVAAALPGVRDVRLTDAAPDAVGGAGRPPG
jgi:CBS domain-containing protein